MPATTTVRDVTSELAFLTRALKAPTLPESVIRLAERGRWVAVERAHDDDPPPALDADEWAELDGVPAGR